jgi:hypothetical protein
MREFYEACEAAIDSKKMDAAVEQLRAAHDLMLPIVNQARARLELRLVADLWGYLEWTAAWVIHKMSECGGEWPGVSPLFLFALSSTYVYPPTTKNRTSLDYRWSKFNELPEKMLPSVPMTAHWPVVRDKTVYEIAR